MSEWRAMSFLNDEFRKEDESSSFMEMVQKRQEYADEGGQ